MKNNRLHIGWDSGIIRHLLSGYQHKADKCLLQDKGSDKPKWRKLSLSDLSGPLVLLVGGLAVSLLVFLVEVLCSHVKRFEANRAITKIRITASSFWDILLDFKIYVYLFLDTQITLSYSIVLWYITRISIVNCILSFDIDYTITQRTSQIFLIGYRSILYHFENF